MKTSFRAVLRGFEVLESRIAPALDSELTLTAHVPLPGLNEFTDRSMVTHVAGQDSGILCRRKRFNCVMRVGGRVHVKVDIARAGEDCDTVFRPEVSQDVIRDHCWLLRARGRKKGELTPGRNAAILPCYQIGAMKGRS